MSEEVPQNRGNIGRLIKEQLLTKLKLITGQQKEMLIPIRGKWVQKILENSEQNHDKKYNYYFYEHFNTFYLF